MTTTIESISNDLAQLVKAVAPHVVRVEARRRIAATGLVLGNGIIATANHVVHAERDIRIGLEGGETVAAQLLGRDPNTDLAFLKTDANLAKFPIAEQSAEVGHLVLALARPGESVRATLGIVSGVGRQWQTGMGGLIDSYLQTDIVMYPGFSGGPLINASGQLLGLNSSGLVRDVSVAIPVSTVLRSADSIAQYGHVKRAFLGISTQTIRLPRSFREQLGRETALLIVGIESNSPADQAGLVLGDTVVAIKNRPVRSHDELYAQLMTEEIGRKIALSIIRGGQLQSLEVTLTERQ